MSFARRVSGRIFTDTNRQRIISELPILQLKQRKHFGINSGHSLRNNKSDKTIYFGIIGSILILTQFAGNFFNEKKNVNFDPENVSILVFLFAVVTFLQGISTNMQFSCPNEFRRISSSFQTCILQIEDHFLKFKTSTTLLNQAIFFAVCEKVMLTKQPVASLYTLFFFNIVTYCVTYIKEQVERKDWNMYIQVTRTSNVRHLAMSTTKIVLEWTKAIVFIMTVVCTLLVFGMEKGLTNYTPSALYFIITGFYFIITEIIYIQFINKIFDWLGIHYFENMESLYVPVILKSNQIFLSLLITVPCLFMGHFVIAIISLFVNIRLKYKELYNENLGPLISYRKELSMFRLGTKEELFTFEDVCAICLHRMTTARVTPCHHFFHAECLRRALHESAERCPICQYNLPFQIS